MTSLRNALVLTCLLLVAAPVWGQDAAATGVMPAVEPVLSHIPAGSLGFVTIGNMQATGSKVDKFIADLGLRQMLPSTDPDNPDKKPTVLELLKGAARLGPGFNPNGGLAVVMLDPKAFDIDLLKLIPGAPGAAATEEKAMMAGPGDAPAAQDVKLPFVIFVPGKGVKDVFGAYGVAEGGKYLQVTLPMGPMFAAQLGSYVLLSPNDKALDAVVAAKKKAAADIPSEQVKVIAKADLAYYLNMKVAAPIINKFLDMAEGQIVMQAGPMAPLMSTYFGIYRNIIGQLDAITVGGRLVASGVVFDEMVSFKADSAYGKAMMAAKATGPVKLNALPDLPYVLAAAATGQTDPQSVKLGMDVIDSLVKSELFKGLPEEETARLKKIVKEGSDQITGVQIVAGGAPAGSGLFGLSIVLKCKSAAKVKELLAEETKLAQALIKHFGANEPDVQKLTVQYLKGMETVGAVSADAIVIDHPDLLDMSESNREEMKKALGEDKVRFFVASPNDTTVVITFGGSRSFLTEALKAAAGTGKIGTDAESAEAMKYLPKDRSSVVLINAANLYELIVNGMKTMAPNAELPPFKISCKTPVAMGVGTAGKSAHVVVYIPTQLVKEVVGIGMMVAGGGGRGGQPPVGPDDF